MKKILLTTASMLFALLSNGQLNYVFSASNQPYVSLTSGATSVNGTTPWDFGSHYIVPIPFSFKINGVTQTQYKMFGGASITPATDTMSTVLISGFSPMDATIVDRGNPSGVSVSPIRYRTDGVTPNRIFKMEYANAGFMAEFSNYGTLTDSMNVQIWVYESSNIIEMRYGTANVSHSSDYFYNHTNPFISFIDHINVATGGSATYYYLKGDPVSPTIDSINAADMTGTESTLTTFPVSGTVYRFTPKVPGTQVMYTDIESLKIYPTITNGMVTIANPQKIKLSYIVTTSQGATTNIQDNLQKETESVDLSSLAPGIYFLKIKYAGGLLTKKLIRQ